MRAKYKYINDRIYGHLGNSVCCQENRDHGEKGEGIRMAFFKFTEQLLKKLILRKRICQIYE